VTTTSAVKPAPPGNRGLSLKVKWTAALLVIGAAPVGLLAYGTIGIQKSGLEVSEKETEIAVIDSVGQAVDRLLENSAEATHRVGRILTEAKIPDEDARLGLAQEAMARSEALAHVGIYLPQNGEKIDAIARGGGAQKKSAIAALEKLPAEVLAAKKAGWLPITFGPQGAEVRFAEPVEREADGQKVVRAWVVGTLEAAVLDDAVAGVSQSHYGTSGRVLLIDDRLKIIAGGKEGPLATGQDLAGKDILAKLPVKGVALRDDFGSSTEYDDAGGAAMVGTLRSLKKWGFGVIVRRPQEEAFRALARARQAFMVTGGAVALAALLGGLVLAGRITRPVEELVDLTRAYGKRDFAVRSKVQTGDELEQLGTSMMVMADDLAASEQEIARRAVVEANLSRYMPAEVARSVAEGGKEIALGGEKRTVSALFADVVSFTTFAEKSPPEQVVALLNELFTVMSEVLFRHGGTVDKFIGDCVMAVFGAPTAQEDHAQRAVQAAEDLHRFVEATAPEWEEKYGFGIRLAIGINSGEAVVGNLGSELRMEYTAIGDVINVAARLEALARPGQTLLTRQAASLAGDDFSFNSLGEQSLRGKEKPIEIVELT
jgi:class 3 adenylate cyclase